MILDNCANCKYFAVWIADDKTESLCCSLKGTTKDKVRMLSYYELAVSGKDCWEYNRELGD